MPSINLRPWREELRAERQKQFISTLIGIAIVTAGLVRSLPDGLYYTRLERKNDEISIIGMAESNNRISGLMRNFESSEWFSSPNLKDVSAVAKKENNDVSLNSFDLTVKQVTPVIKSESDSGKGAK